MKHCGLARLSLLKRAGEGSVEEIWELIPYALRGLVCCLAPGGRLIQIKALSGYCGCFLPPRAKETLGKLFDLADERCMEAENKA